MSRIELLTYTFISSLALSLGVGVAPNCITTLFVLDSLSCFLSGVSICIGAFYIGTWSNTISSSERVCLVVSVASSILCFSTNNALLFWFFYELTIISLLVSLMSHSPYSERFLATWYLAGYVIFGSLPVLLVIIWAGVECGSYNISQGYEGFGVQTVVLFILFSCKVPLAPFHSWLPVVHAEASTYVSVCLSGFVMKLGIAGIFRFCSPFFNTFPAYIVIIFLFSIGFYTVSSWELDSKRWLAMLSLVHILIPVIAMHLSQWYVSPMAFVSCFGHGLSAGLMFHLFAVLYNSCGSRNWIVVAQGAVSGQALRWLLVVSMATTAAFPISISFIAEVTVLGWTSVSSTSMVVMSVYLFFGGIVPFVLMGTILTNNIVTGNTSNLVPSTCLPIVALVVVWFAFAYLF